MPVAIISAIAEAVVEVVTVVVELWEALKEVRVVGNIVKGVACTLQWSAYLSLVFSTLEFLEDISIPKAKIAELLGIQGLIPKGQDIKKKVSSSLQQVKTTINNAKEIDARLKMAPSPYNGVWSPPYHSIAIHEIVYEFSNVLGNGNMIIIFNPEGFGMKPRPPEIIRYVTEAEFAEFINSKSWGNYWRVNYLLNKRKRRFKSVQGKDIFTNDYHPMPDSEPLDDYLERVLHLPEYADNVIAGEFKEQILEALDKHEKITTAMTRAIEKGSLGRGVEENGLRVTNALNEAASRIPANLKRIVATNPVFKDVAKVLPVYKKAANRIRNIKGAFAGARHLSSLSAESVAIAANLGTLGQVQSTIGIATDFSFQIGKDLGLEATRTGSIAANEFAAANEQLLASAAELNQLKTVTDEAFAKLDALGDISKGKFAGEFGDTSFDDAVSIIEELTITLNEAGLNIPNKVSPEILEDILTTALEEGVSLAEAAKTGILGELFSFSTLADVGIGALKPPTCIPFIS